MEHSVVNGEVPTGVDFNVTFIPSVLLRNIANTHVLPGGSTQFPVHSRPDDLIGIEALPAYRRALYHVKGIP